MARQIITQYNFRNYFNLRLVGYNQIKSGMLLKFNYWSPNGVHDPRPLIYVLNVERDRVWGLNLDYKFILMAEIMTNKRNEIIALAATLQAKAQEKQEIQESIKSVQSIKSINKTSKVGVPKEPSQKELKQKVDKEGILPKLPRLKKILQKKSLPSLGYVHKIGPKKTIPKPGASEPEKQAVIDLKKIPQSMLELYQLDTRPTTILRNYLPKRMNGVYKLLYKVK